MNNITETREQRASSWRNCSHPEKKIHISNFFEFLKEMDVAALALQNFKIKPNEMRQYD